MKSDIEIAQSTVLRPINDIILQLGIDPEMTETCASTTSSS